MLVSNFTQGEMQEELFMNFKEGICMMIAVNQTYGPCTLATFLDVEPLKLN